MKFKLSLTGENSEKIIQAAIDSGNEIPQALLDKPDLPQSMVFFWTAFLELNTCRGEGNIPWTAIDRYAERYDVTDDLFEDLVEIIALLDDAMIEHREKERKKK